MGRYYHFYDIMIIFLLFLLIFSGELVVHSASSRSSTLGSYLFMVAFEQAVNCDPWKCHSANVTHFMEVTLYGGAAKEVITLIARYMEPTWGPSGADRTQVGPRLAPWTLLFGNSLSLLWRNRKGLIWYIKLPFYQYRDSHDNDKMVSWPFYLYHGYPFTSNTVCVLNQGPAFATIF